MNVKSILVSSFLFFAASCDKNSSPGEEENNSFPTVRFLPVGGGEGRVQSNEDDLAFIEIETRGATVSLDVITLFFGGSAIGFRSDFEVRLIEAQSGELIAISQICTAAEAGECAVAFTPNLLLDGRYRFLVQIDSSNFGDVAGESEIFVTLLDVSGFRGQLYFTYNSRS